MSSLSSSQTSTGTPTTQSSRAMSSQRKRTIPSLTESDSPSSKPKRLRLSLKKNWRETLTQSSSYAGRSETATSSNLLRQPSKRISYNSNYVELAKKFGISVEVAKKHHNILAKAPTIPVVRIVNVKQEIFSPCNSTFMVNPVFKPTKKLKLKFRTGDSIKIKKEPDEPVQMPVNVSSKIVNYLDSLNRHSPIKQEKLSPENSPIKQELFSPERTPSYNNFSLKDDSPSPVKNPLSKWRNIIDTDGDDDDFSTPVPESFRKTYNPLHVKKEKKAVNLKPNPFSVKQNKSQKNAKVSAKSKESKNSTVSKKKAKKSGIKDSKNVAENKNQKELENKDKRNKLWKIKNQMSDSDCLESNDSMSVNCPQFFSSQNKEKESETVKSEDNVTKRQPLSFGTRYGVDDDDDDDDDYLDYEFQENDVPKTKEKLNTIFHSIESNLGKPAENQSDTTKKSCTDSQPKSSGCNGIEKSTPEEKAPPKSIPPKAKPVIKSDDKLSSAIKLLPKIKKKVVPLGNNQMSNDLQHQREINGTVNKSNKQGESKGVFKCSLNSGAVASMARGTSSQVGGTKMSLANAKFNFTRSLNKIAQEKKTTSNDSNIDNDIEESFDSLCRDVSGMLEENITLYKDDTTLLDGSGTGEKVMFRLSGNMPNNEETEQSTLEKATQRTRLTSTSQCSQGLQSPTTTQLGQSSSVDTPSASSRDPRLNRSISPVKTPTVASRDPRLNRSMTPVKPVLSATVTSGALNQQTDSPTSADPRLRRRQLNEKAEESANISRSESEKEMSPMTTPKRSSVQDRLGSKMESSHQVMKNEFTNVISEGRKSICYESEDDGLSIFADDIELSDEEKESSSPRHQKFVQERVSIDDEMAYTPAEDRRCRFRGNNNDINKTLNTNAGVGRRIGPNWGPTIPSSSGIASRLGVRANSNVNEPKPQSVRTRIGLMNSDTTFNDFRKMNEMQMLKDQANFQTQQLENNEFVTFGENGIANGKPTLFENESMLSGNTKQVELHPLVENRTTFFRNFCFKVLRYGQCHNGNICKFEHKVNFLYKLVKQKTPELLFHLLNYALTYDFNFFLSNVWVIALPILQKECFKMFEKYYKKNLHSEKIVNDLLKFCINEKICTADSFAKQISPIIDKQDIETVHIVCNALKGKITDGFYWEAIKDLASKAMPPKDMIELAILQCLSRKKNPSHIKELYDLVNNKMSKSERSLISLSLLDKFQKFVESQNIVASKEVLTTVPLMSNNNASISSQRKQSVDGIENKKPPVLKTKRTNSLSQENGQPNDSPLQVGSNTPIPGESFSSTYDLQEVDGSTPSSAWHKRFWKLYNAEHCVQEGLGYADYAYVWRTLDQFSQTEKMDNVFLKRAYYHILCKNVLAAERHVSGIIKQAVRSSCKNEKLIDILFDVGLNALIELANCDLWIMAHKLLSFVKMIEPAEPRTDFILICAEIYIANNDPLEALYLLQKTRLIKTNRDEWLVKSSTKYDEKHRNKVVFILLKALSYKDQEKAVYLFKIILQDQYISYYPIDLPSWIDKLVLLLLLFKKHDLAIEMSRLVMDTDLTFQKGTYQELITHLLPVDEVVTNQLLEYATQIGYYPDIKIFYGFTSLIIDTNYTDEELYLVINRLLSKISLNVGPVIERLTPNQLKVILSFEDIPDSKRLFRNEIHYLKKEDPYKNIKSRVKTLLAERFHPAIRISHGKVNNGCKLMSRTIVEYLKYWSASV